MTETMRAAVLTGPGPVENFEIRELPVPEPAAGWVRIAVRAAGLNRSDLHLRQGLAENSRGFPVVPGIEAVGVLDSPGAGLEMGQQVAAMMGGMGREFDGGYAEYVVVPRTQVVPFRSELPWEVIGAVPETLQTAHAADLPGRGGCGARAGGTPTLPDTLAATRVRGTVCFTGMLSNEWTVRDFYPISYLPTAVRLTSYSGDPGNLPAAVLQDFLDRIADGSLDLGPVHAYGLGSAREAHRDLESGRHGGKLVLAVAR